MPGWPCATWRVMSAGRKAGLLSGRDGSRTREPVERHGRGTSPHRPGGLLLCRRPLCLIQSLLHPASQALQCSPPPSNRPIPYHSHRLNLVLCVLLQPILGDGLFSAVVPLSKEVRELQKSHAHPPTTPIC